MRLNPTIASEHNVSIGVPVLALLAQRISLISIVIKKVAHSVTTPSTCGGVVWKFSAKLSIPKLKAASLQCGLQASDSRTESAVRSPP